jgi:glycosyltransferase involved in cell wall biosynthesis
MNRDSCVANRLHVAIICGAGIVSGKEIMALELGRGLRDAGYEVSFITSGWGSSEFVRRSEAMECATYRLWLGFISATLRFDAVRMTLDQLLHWPALVWRYRQLLRTVEPIKIVHTNWQHAFLLWPFLQPDRDIFWLHEVIPNKSQYRRLFRSLIKRLGCIVAVSRAAAGSIINLGIPAERVRVIYNGIGDARNGSLPKNAEAVPIIGIVGQIGPWKGHEDLLNAFQEILSANPSVHLHIFGNGSVDYVAFLQQRCSELGLSDNVVWRGFVESRAEIYNEIDILAVPSQSEDPLPTSAIEAAFFGIPVIASRRGGLPEIVDHGITGLIFEPGDTAGLAANVNSLLTDASLRYRMAQEARARAKTLFSRDRFVQDFIDLLKQPLAS